MNSLFCRHNRFTADCPICSKGTVLGSSPSARERKPRPAAGRAASGSSRRKIAPRYAGPYVSAGPYERAEQARAEVRLERVPGGLRLAEWSGGEIARRAPVLEARELARLVSEGGERQVLEGSEAQKLAGALAAPPAEPAPGEAPHGASPGRSGDMQEELRVEPAGEGLVRIARWILRPGSGWELQEAPVMMPAARYAEALRGAARRGILPRASDAGESPRP